MQLDRSLVKFGTCMDSIRFIVNSCCLVLLANFVISTKENIGDLSGGLNKPFYRLGLGKLFPHDARITE